MRLRFCMADNNKTEIQNFWSCVPLSVQTECFLFRLFSVTAVQMNSVFSLVQAEARLAAKRAARAEARDIRMRELERQQKEVSVTENI